jgi:hypothetical protein
MIAAFPVPIWFGVTPPHHPPLNPTAVEARNQLLHELAKLGYREAQPSWIQEIGTWLENLFDSLFGHANLPSGGPNLIILIVAVLVIAAAVVGFLVFGLPRINRRSSLKGALFGEDDDRDSDALRTAARRAAADGDFTTAIEELFRAIARGLSERTVLTTFPGTTAHGFAQEAERAFPDFGPDLRFAADSFDGVRYLGATGTESQWLQLNALDTRLSAARPVLEEVDA